MSTSGAGMDEKGEVGDESIQGVLDFNNLQYEAIPDLSVVNTRTRKTSPANEPYLNNVAASGPGSNRSVIVLNTGSDYINGKQCFLQFTPALTTGTTTGVWFNSLTDTAFNFIKNLKIKDSSGRVLEEIQDCNYLASVLIPLKCTNDWWESSGTLIRPWYRESVTLSPAFIGQNSPLTIITKQLMAGAAVEQFFTYQLPLHLVSGLFASNELLPPGLMSGLRIEVEWENLFYIMSCADAVAPVNAGYQLADIAITTDSFALTDTVRRELNIRAANEGLEIQFRTWDSSASKTVTVPANVSSYQLSVINSRSVSRAFRAIAALHESRTTVAGPKQPLESVGYYLKSYQWHVGNDYYPQTKALLGQGYAAASLSANIMAPLAFRDALCAYNKMDGHHSSGLQMDDFMLPTAIPSSTTQTVLTYGGRHPLVLDLERSQVQDVSGIPLNDSRRIELEIELKGGTNSYTITPRLYLEYMKIVRVFLLRVEVEQ